jgi:hypothetical protein
LANVVVPEQAVQGYPVEANVCAFANSPLAQSVQSVRAVFATAEVVFPTGHTVQVLAHGSTVAA